MNDIAPLWHASCTVKTNNSLPLLMQCIYYSVLLRLQNACRTISKDIYTQDSVLEYMGWGALNSHLLLFMNWPWLISQALELCQCASNSLHFCLKCTSQNVTHHIYHACAVKTNQKFFKGLVLFGLSYLSGIPISTT